MDISISLSPLHIALMIGLHPYTRGTINVRRNNEARLRNHCCRAKAISITYSDCVFRALGTYHAMRMHRVILTVCGLSGSTAFFYIITQTTRF
jgi:hypothetical protein